MHIIYSIKILILSAVYLAINLITNTTYSIRKNIFGYHFYSIQLLNTDIDNIDVDNTKNRDNISNTNGIFWIYFGTYK